MIRWDVDTGDKVFTRTFTFPDPMTYSRPWRYVIPSPDDQYVAMVQVYNGSIMVFRVETGELIAEFREQPEEYCSIVILCPDLPEPETVTSAAWSPDGNIITLGLKDGRILLRDAKTGEKLRYLVGHNDEVGYLEWSRDGMLLISFSEDGTTLVWDMSE